MKTETKKIGLKLFLIALPGLAWCAFQISLPLEQFTFRAWESLFLPNKVMGPFYPLQNLKLNEVGDLSHNSETGIPKTVRFATDEEGFRNDAPACPDPVAIVIGDSMAVGTSLSQENILSSQLSKEYGKCVRSFAGGSMPFALNYALVDLGLRPKWVILVVTQRTAGNLKKFPDPSSALKIGLHSFSSLRLLIAQFLSFRKNFYWNFRAHHGISKALERMFTKKELLPHQTLSLSETAQKKEMLFYPDDWKRNVSEEEINQDIDHLETLSKNLKKFGANLAFTYVPNKSTIYPHTFDDQDPDFITHFKQKLRNPSFLFLDLFTPFRDDFTNHGVYNHHLDDTHWNSHGVQIMVKEFRKKVDL